MNVMYDFKYEYLFILIVISPDSTGGGTIYSFVKFYDLSYCLWHNPRKQEPLFMSHSTKYVILPVAFDKDRHSSRGVFVITRLGIWLNFPRRTRTFWHDHHPQIQDA
jgi:hypothetical protein